MEVGADATEAKAESPGRDGPRELGKALPLLLLLGLWVYLSRELASGSVPEYCDDADDAPAPVSVVD